MQSIKAKLLCVCTILSLSFSLQAQNFGTISGNLMTNLYFFDRDSSINAANNPLYDNFLSGGESWLSLRYSYKNFSANVRMDAFHNSNLLNLTSETNGFGIGAWTVNQDFKDLQITGGYIYDQIGSGILLRTYEDRGLLIDNALVGLRLQYKLTDNIHLKGYTGQHKFLYTRYTPIVKALNIDGNFNFSDKTTILPGIGLLNRTLDKESMNSVVAAINSQSLETRFTPMYNTYGFTAYNTLNIGDLSWYLEGAYKTHEAIVKHDYLQDLSGTVLYSTLGYAQKGIAVNLSGKRTENFVLRTSPNEVLLRGMMNWQPVVARLRPQRLLARYSPASQDISEIAVGADVLIAPKDDWDLTLNYTHINTLEKEKLYREAYAEFNYNSWSKGLVKLGIQYLEYNIEKYQVKPGAPLMKAITPFAEVVYRFNSKTSLRAEVEYMHTEQDFGSWVFALAELNITPTWSFAISDMYITKLNPANPVGLTNSKHFYNLFAAYTKGAHRFTAAYVKQVEGINCTGGVCRYEPAFSGLKFGVTSSF